jgi:glycosyltransferase involved in cell wall biosynthesis
MKILFVGLDRQVFVQGSEAHTRIQSYTSLAEEVHLIVFTKHSMGFETTQPAPNIFLHPTNSRSKVAYVLDAIRMGRALKGITLVSAQDPFECALAAIPVARTLGARLQIQMHIDAFSPYFKTESPLNRVRRLMARYTLPRADCIRVVSERIKESVLTQRLSLRTKPVVLPVYVDTRRFEHAQRSDVLRTKYPKFETIVLMAGRLVAQKDISTALRAFALVVHELPASGLIIVGEGPDQSQLEALRDSLGLEDTVHFEPWQTDILPYLMSADIFLMTSTHEGYQRALGEAAAAGVPVVTTETGPVGSVYRDQDSVLACAVGDDACIARGLIVLARDPVRRDALAARAREVARDAIATDPASYLAQYRTTLVQCAANA